MNEVIIFSKKTNLFMHSSILAETEIPWTLLEGALCSTECLNFSGGQSPQIC